MKHANKLKQYRGRLNPEGIATGINVSMHNAQRLAGDARLLLDAGRFPSAASLAALSIEESGKVPILRGLALARTQDELQESWRHYRTHTKKNFAWILPTLTAKGAKHLEDFQPLFDPDSDHPLLLDQVKQLGFYSDCLGTGHWSAPTAVVDQRLADTLVRIAEFLARGDDKTVREIELWVEHVGPVWKGKMEWMKKALANWYEAMRAEGLLPASAVDMDAFLWGHASHSKKQVDGG